MLQQLTDVVAIEHFEVMRPSLHDIFVRIAKPELDEQPAEELLAG